MKMANIIFTVVLLSIILTGCGTATEELTNSVGTQAGTSAETETEASTEAEAETETTAETSAPAEKKEVFALNGPLGRYQGPEEFDNANFAASFEEADLVKTNDGTFSLTVMICRYEMFSEEEINTLKKGDVIWCLGEEVVVDTIETRTDGAIVINGGIENGGRILKTEDNAVYFEAGMNDRKSYYEIGENTYTLAADFVLTDHSDPENDQSVTYTAEEFLALDHGDAGFINANTMVKTVDGVITAIERRYIP